MHLTHPHPHKWRKTVCNLFKLTISPTHLLLFISRHCVYASGLRLWIKKLNFATFNDVGMQSFVHMISIHEMEVHETNKILEKSRELQYFTYFETLCTTHINSFIFSARIKNLNHYYSIMKTNANDIRNCEINKNKKTTSS